MDLPRPTIYRKKKFTSTALTADKLENVTAFHAVPPFFDFKHSTTTWLINTVRSQNEKELLRVLRGKASKKLLEFTPDPKAIQKSETVIDDNSIPEFVITKSKYFQILDRPNYYDSRDTRTPLFNRHAVLYLTPLGLAIYLKKPKIVRLLVEHRDRDTCTKLMLGRQPQYVTFMNDQGGDLMCMYDHNLAILNETYDILGLMLKGRNWFPMEPFQLVYRKLYVETYLYFDDFLDYAFYVMLTRRSSIDIPGLCDCLLGLPSANFRVAHLSQMRRASKEVLLRDTNLIINNCKSYPRRLLRCAYYADKKMKSTMNLIRSAEIFVRSGMFKLVGNTNLAFIPQYKAPRRLARVPRYKEHSRNPSKLWPQAMYEFDADCCIALLLALISKSHRLNKIPTFQAALRLTVLLLSETGWISYLGRISDLELKDYFMGLDDAEKVVFHSEVCGFVREAVRITVVDQKFDLVRFFNEAKLDEVKTKDTTQASVLSDMIICDDEYINDYLNVLVGERLENGASIIGGRRLRGQGRDNPANIYYMNRLGFPPESAGTMMTNAANVDTSDSQITTTAEASADQSEIVNNGNTGKVDNENEEKVDNDHAEADAQEVKEEKSTKSSDSSGGSSSSSSSCESYQHKAQFVFNSKRPARQQKRTRFDLSSLRNKAHKLLAARRSVPVTAMKTR